MTKDKLSERMTDDLRQTRFGSTTSLLRIGGRRVLIWSAAWVAIVTTLTLIFWLFRR
jgi:hypothetical protein